MHDEADLVTQIVSVLERSQNGILSMPKKAEKTLRTAFQDAPPTLALRGDVLELMAFAVFVGEEQGSPDLARLLLDIASEATPALERLAEAGDLMRADTRDRSKTLLGRDRQKRAPQVSERAPEGSVRPSSFIVTQPQRLR